MLSKQAKKRAAQRAAQRAAAGKIMDRATIPPGYTSPGKSLFLKKLPREVSIRTLRKFFQY
jgi:hypothetical protein